MSPERLISSRLDFRGRITVAATAVSFFVIIVSLMVVGGFRREIRSGIGSLMGDVQLTADVVESSDSLLSAITAVKGVESVTPAVYRTAVVKTESGLQGVLVKGVPLEGESLTMSIPPSLSRKLGVGPGDALTTYFIGDKVKVRKFTVSDIFRDMLLPDDRAIVQVPLADLQRVNGWDSTQVSALEVRLSPKFNDAATQRAKAQELSAVGGMRAQAAVDRYSRLFEWLGLLDYNVAAILLLMTLVAGFNMVSGLLIMLFRNTGTIGTLKALGMGNRGISKVFLRVASGVTLKGLAWGGGAAALFAIIQGTTHLLRLNPENYFVSYVPIAVDPLKIVLVCAAAYAVIMILLLLPALFIARVDPAETVRVK